MLWFRRASDGGDIESFTLQVPFQLGPTHSFEIGDSPPEFELGSLRGEILENKGVHLLRLRGFKSKEEAEAFLPRVHGALLRLTVVSRLSLRVDASLQRPTLLESPVDVRKNPNFGNLVDHIGWTHLDGWVDPIPAVIIPEYLRLMEAGAGAAKVTVGLSAEKFISTLCEGLDLYSPEGVASDKQLALAIDLYAASHWESVPRARVITLVTTLEALLKPETVVPVAQEHLTFLLEVLKGRRNSASEDPEQTAELDRLASRLAGLKSESISSRLRRLIMSEADVLGETEDEATASIALAYRVRSELLHEGHSEPTAVRTAAAWLHTAVPSVLEAHIKRRSTAI